jgi:hypothetical protein
MNFFLTRFFVTAVKANRNITLRKSDNTGKRVTTNSDERVDGKTGKRVDNRLDMLRKE